MKPDGVGGLLLLAIVTVLALLSAAATLPDQTWIPGIYDAADLDDLVILVTDLSGDQGHSPELSPPLHSVVDSVSLNMNAYETPDSRSMARGPPKDRSAHVISGVRHPTHPAVPQPPPFSRLSAVLPGSECPELHLFTKEASDEFAS